MVTIVERTFGTPTILITLNYLVFPISHALFAAPVNWCLTKKGLRFSYHIASITMVAGVWLRTTLSEDNPYTCLLGSILCGFGYLFVMNSASKVTMNWFRSEVMTSVTFVSALSTMLSLSFSSVIPGFLLDSSSTKEDVTYFLRFEAILITVPFILLTLFFREKPEYPPSKTA
jgi:MFS family permease